MTIEQLLDRQKIDDFVDTKLSAPISLLRELVDEGVIILDKCGYVGGDISDVIIIGHFFKHTLAMLDAVEILLTRGAVLAAGVPSRSMLEAYIYLEWLLRLDTASRTRHFYVWHIRQKREWARRVIPGTEEFKRTQKHMSTLSEMQDTAKRTALEAKAKQQDKVLTDILSSSENTSINAQFDKLKKRHFDVAWYKPTGAQSIGDMANKLSLGSEYTFFYSQFSDISHAGAFDKHVKFAGKGVILEPIRSPEGIDTVVNLVATLAFRIYRLMLTKYVPSDLPLFDSNYITQWRKRFLSVPTVVVNNHTET